MGNIWILVLAAVGVSLLLMEWGVARARHMRTHSTPTTLASLANGAGALFAGMVISMVVIYGVVERSFGLFELSADHWATWVLAIVALDFVFYWAHRICHQVPLLWAMHVVHHQSHEYNLSTGARSPWLQPLMYAPFTALLALSGIPVEVMGPVYLAQQVWKLVVHTQLVGHLGPLEWFLATPRHHAVHHACNQRFLGRNFGGLFIVWDRAFATFTELDEVPVFGIGAPVDNNPVRNNLAPWKHLIGEVRAAPTLRERVRALLYTPLTLPEHHG